MADMTQLATLGNLKRVVENMKVYVDSDKTTSIKGYLKKNNTHNFYNTSTPTEDTTPIFSFDVGEEMSLDQTNTTFVQEFEWSDENYPNSTNPNLDGQAVLVLATKSNDVVSYSFVNLETLVDTYKTKNTTTLSLDITDNEISGNVNISTEDGNAVVVKDDGLYVPTTAEIKVSEADGNIIEVKDDGIYVAPTDLNEYAKTEDIPTVTNDLTDELKAQYDKAEENVQSDWNETDETSDAFIKNKPTIPSTDGLATETFVTDKIAEAQLGGEEVDLSGYVKTETLADYSTTAESDEKYVLDEEIETITAEQIEELIGLSADEITNLASLLSDQTIELSKTWSSSKIYSELNTTLDSAKQYTLDELSKAIGASYKVVTSVDQMTDSKVLYLLKDADSGMYNIYVYDADTSTAELIGSFEINLDDYLKISDAEAQYVKQTDLVANYATKQELTDAIADVEVEVSQETNNLLENRDDGLYVGSGDVVISKADYDALDEETRNNGQTYFIYDDETTEDGTDLSQFAKVSNLEDGTITVGNSKKLNGLTKDELFADTNSKIEEINNNLTCLGVNNHTLNTNNWNDIEKNEHTPLTFFTNWHNETDFPTVHGSGVIIPGLDSRYKYVLYIVGDGVLYTCLMVTTANGYTMGAWRKASNE